MTPQDLLAEADELLTTVVPGTRGRWPRACAWLIRLALEQSLDDLWATRLPQAAACGMRPQLLLLPRHANQAVAAQSPLRVARTRTRHPPPRLRPGT